MPELAEALGVAEDVVIEALDARTAYRPGSLSAPTDRDGGRTLGDSLASPMTGASVMSTPGSRSNGLLSVVAGP